MSGLVYHQGIRVIRRFFTFVNLRYSSYDNWQPNFPFYAKNCATSFNFKIYVSQTWFLLSFKINMNDIKWFDFPWPFYFNFIFFQVLDSSKVPKYFDKTSLKFSWEKISRNRPYSYRAGLRFGESCSILRHHVG